MERKTGWQVEGISNYGPNVVSFLLTTGRRRWYVVGAYVPPNDASTIAHVEQALGKVAKGVEFIILGDLNVRLRETCDAREEEIVRVVAECGPEDMTAHFMLRRKYIGDGRWTWWMRREDQKVKKTLIIPRPWSAHQVSSRVSERSKHTRYEQREKEKLFGRVRGYG